MSEMIQPRSKWGFASPSKGAVQHQVKEGYKQQLLQEAASLLPDYAKLSDMLLSQDMHLVDQVRVKNVLDSYTQAYMDKYANNPFYSFSREGRSLAKQMSSIVQNPTLKSFSDSYKHDQGKYEQATKDGITSQYDVNEAGIRVQTADGQVTRKTRLEKGDTPLTVDDSYQYLHNIVGSAGGNFDYNMSSDKDLEDNINNAFDNIGDDKVARDILAEGRREVQSGNNRQINSRIKWLMGQGMSQANLNRLYAEYVRKSGNFDMNEAKKYAVHYVMNYANGARDSSSDISYIDDVRKAGAGYGSKEKEVELPTPYTSAILGSEGKRTISLQTPGGQIMVGEGNILTNDVFKAAPKAYTDDGVEYRSHKITDLDVFRKAISQGAYVPVAVANKDIGSQAGEFKEAPKSAFKHMVISESEPPSLQVMIKDSRGNPASASDTQRINLAIQNRQPIPSDLRKYFSTDGQGTPVLNKGYFLHGQGMVPRRRGGFTGSTSNDDAEASDYFSNLGHNSVDDDIVRQEYNQFNGEKDKTTSSVIGFNDQIYKVDVFIPVTNTEIFMGDKVRGTSDALLMGDTSRLQDPSTPVDKGYLGLAPFNQTTNPNNYVSYPKR